jgi:hypothetical protein
MKTKLIFFVFMLYAGYNLFGQPATFSWNKVSNIDYVSDARNQMVGGPCHAFASIAATEAAAQIYYNSSVPLDLSEQELFSEYCPGNIATQTYVPASLNFISDTGVVDDACYPFMIRNQQSQSYYALKADLPKPCTSPSKLVKIAGYTTLTITSNAELQRAIMSKGPIIVTLVDFATSKYTCSGGHSILVIGWKTVNSTIQWEVKDSWQNQQYVGFMVFLNNQTLLGKATYFYAIVHNNGAGKQITCEGTECSGLESRHYTDLDQDGFYYWGIGPKPAGCPGPCLMDFDDNITTGGSVICLNSSYIPQAAPVLTGGSDYICGTTTFTLQNVPQNFSVSWSVSPGSYFSSSTSGTTNSATITPLSTAIGKLCTITFTIDHNVDHCQKQYTKSFVINGPREDQVVISAQFASGGTPPKSGTIWLLCPNTIYYLYLNNSSTCATSGYNWVLPSTWTLNYQTSNYASITTGSLAGGTVKVYATTCCGYKLIRTQNFGASTSCQKSTQHVFEEEIPPGITVIYPNPAQKSQLINIKLGTDIDCSSAVLHLFDLSGREILNLKTTSDRSFEIQAGSLQAGSYVVQVDSKKGQYKELLIIK